MDPWFADEPRPEGGPRFTGAGTYSRPIALVKGGGDLASGVALRLLGAGFAVVVTEIDQPTAVRRTVSLAEAVYEGRVCIEGVVGVRATGLAAVWEAVRDGVVPVVVDPRAEVRLRLKPDVVVDAVMAKRNLGTRLDDARAVVAIGPGFVAGVDVHAVVETMRGHELGRVMFHGAALPDTGVPGEVGGASVARVMRAPCGGVFQTLCEIGDVVERGQAVGRVGDVPVRAGLDGMVRGLLHPGLTVQKGCKVGDVDPRCTTEHCHSVSDKARAVGGGVLEAACSLLGGVAFTMKPGTAAGTEDEPRVETGTKQRGIMVRRVP